MLAHLKQASPLGTRLVFILGLLVERLCAIISSAPHQPRSDRSQVGRPLARSFVRGYNCAALFLGESGAGHTATLTGRHGEEEGFLNMLIGDIFASLDDDKSFAGACVQLGPRSTSCRRQLAGGAPVAG